jgi:cell wall-associated NlpC family hydrolase
VSEYDPRLTPARPDLAAKHLQGQVAAARFVDGTLFEVIEPQAPMRRGPSPDAALETEALKGERVTIYETDEEGWAWGQLQADGYVGWLPASALSMAREGEPTHKVTALRTLAFPGPDIKLPPVESLALGARLAVVRMQGAFAVTATDSYVPGRHLAPVASAEADFVAVAERFVGTPYLWGGKSNLGIDCSGLVQTALIAAGIACPRDSDMQERALGTALASDAALAGLQRGDVVFWKGHVGIMRDAATLLHANAFHMAVTTEALAEAVARISASGSDISAIKRLTL